VVIAFSVTYPNKLLFFSLCIGHYLFVRFVLVPRFLKLRLVGSAQEKR
jgi:hypothetical protein